MIQKVKTIPKGSSSEKHLTKTHYFDSYMCYIPWYANFNFVEAVDVILNNNPKWMRLLFNIRGWLAKLLNLEHDSLIKNSNTSKPSLIKNTKVNVFTVADTTKNEKVLKINDTHLSAVLSLFIADSIPTSSLTITTLVEFHNTKGRFYFAIIKPFHKYIIKNMLKRLLRHYGKQNML